MQKQRVLIVEDELIAAESLKEFLQEEPIYEVVDIVDKGNDAINKARVLQPDIIFMDVMLKDGISGDEAALKISTFCKAKIIFITAYAQNEMIDYASQAKAVAYLVKPYNKTQILATLRLITQKKEVNTVASHLVLLDKNYTFNLSESQLYLDDKRVKLGPRARDLLALLCHTPGTTISNEQIYMHIWEKEVNANILRALVYRIKTTLNCTLIENVNGIGYKVRIEHP